MEYVQEIKLRKERKSREEGAKTVVNHTSTDGKTAEAVVPVDAGSTGGLSAFDTMWIGSSGRMNLMVLASSMSVWESILSLWELTY